MDLTDILLRLSKITLGVDSMNIYGMLCIAGMMTHGFYRSYQLKRFSPLLFLSPAIAYFYYQTADFITQLIFGLTRVHPLEFFASSFNVKATLFIYLILTSIVVLYREYLDMRPLILICILWSAITFYIIPVYGVSNIYVLEGKKRAMMYGTLYIPGWTALAVSYFWFWRQIASKNYSKSCM